MFIYCCGPLFTCEGGSLWTAASAPDVLHYVSSAANCSLKPAWYQKWIVHRTARPEEIAGRVHCQIEKKAAYPIHASVFESHAVGETRSRFGSALLPQAYPEGAPTHPAFRPGTR